MDVSTSYFTKKEGPILKMRDLKVKEIIGLAPWVILVFLMGIYPEPFMDKFEPSITHYLTDILHIGAAK